LIHGFFIQTQNASLLFRSGKETISSLLLQLGNCAKGKQIRETMKNGKIGKGKEMKKLS
jgi:hypothetical protein